MRERAKAFGAVEIVGVDGCERLVDFFFRGEDGLGCTPGLGATGRQGESSGERVEFLEGELDGDAALKAAADGVAEGLFDVFADDENDFAETGAQGVVDGVVHDGLAAGTDRIDLLQSAIAAAHAGS